MQELWDPFVIYVNAYYAVQEAYDSARRNWEKPADGLDAFCRDANPFLWDEQGSAEEALYHGFLTNFEARFEDGCSAMEGLDFARSWLADLEGPKYGTSLVSSLEATADEQAWCEACDPVSRQLAARRSRLERSPQEEPMSYDVPAHRQPSKEDIDAVILMLAKGDEEFAATLRARLAQED